MTTHDQSSAPQPVPPSMGQDLPLEACPFCGGMAFCHDFRGGAGYWQVECQDCGATTDGRSIKFDAIEVWNRRGSLAAPVAQSEPVATPLLCELDYAINHGWPTESLSRLAIIRTADVSQFTTPAPQSPAPQPVADWSNRRTDNFDGWVNELLTLADRRDRHEGEIPRFAVEAMRTIARGLVRFGPAPQAEREAGTSAEVSRLVEAIDEIRSTLQGAHTIMESLSAIERRVGPVGSHARGYTHKITNALRHLERLATQQASRDAAAVLDWCWSAPNEYVPVEGSHVFVETTDGGFRLCVYRGDDGWQSDDGRHSYEVRRWELAANLRNLFANLPSRVTMPAKAEGVTWEHTDETLWRSTVEMLVDVYFDGVENAPGEGVYVSGTLNQGMEDSRALLKRTPPKFYVCPQFGSDSPYASCEDSINESEA